MSTRDLVDPELLPLLDSFPTFELTPELLGQLRRGELLHLPKAAPDVSGLTMSERRVLGPAGAPQVPVLIYTPEGEAPAGGWPAILHLHGGGFVMGDPSIMHDTNVARVRQVGCVIVSVDYRLAPETKFPGAIEDCYAALRWLNANTAELNVDAARIAVVGESAGGGLSASLALMARDRGEFQLCFQLLDSPLLDDRTANTVPVSEALGEFVWTRHSSRFGWSAYLEGAPGGEGVSPYAAAARETKLAGLPPTFLCVGAIDLLADEALAYARRLISAGVPTELHVYPRAFHAFILATEAHVTRQYERDTIGALRRAFGLKA